MSSVTHTTDLLHYSRCYRPDTVCQALHLSCTFKAPPAVTPKRATITKPITQLSSFTYQGGLRAIYRPGGCYQWCCSRLARSSCGPGTEQQDWLRPQHQAAWDSCNDVMRVFGLINLSVSSRVGVLRLQAGHPDLDSRPRDERIVQTDRVWTAAHVLLRNSATRKQCLRIIISIAPHFALSIADVLCCCLSP
jgi:hypothetical protein